MPKKGYKQTADHKRKCGLTRMGDKNPMKRLEVRQKFKEMYKKHKPNCQCIACKAKRGERYKHLLNCQCLHCRMKRGELIGEKNPMFGKGYKGKDNPMYEYIFSEEQKKARSERVAGNKNPMYGMVREKSPNWRGGISFEPYGLEFNNKLKERIRKRDNYQCQICDERQNGRKFPVHHKDYDKRNNEDWNLITLCIPCHQKTNFNRKYWVKYFKRRTKLKFSVLQQDVVEQCL